MPKDVPGIESRDSNRYLHTHVHSDVIPDNQKVEAIKVLTGGRMDTKMWEIYVHI